MVWFEGAIPEAIQAAQSKSLLFLVLVADDNEESVIMESLFYDEQISEFLQKSSVALRLDASSQDAANFAQIYPIKSVPSLYILHAKSRTLFETMTSTPEVNTVLEKFKRYFEASQLIPETSQTPNPAPSTNNSTPTGNQTFSDVAQPKVSRPLTEEEKKEELKRLREKVALKIKEKEEKERAEKLENEKKRRKEGKEMIEAKHKQEENQLKLLAEQRKKEKKEDEEARRKIREQLARDREEKAKQRELERQQSQSLNQSNSTSIPVSSASANHEFAALAIRLTNGEILKERFKAQDTLAIVRKFIDEKRTDGHSPYVIMTNFPYRYFTEHDINSSLLDLGLTPSCTVILKPSGTVSEAYSGVSQSRRGNSTAYISTYSFQSFSAFITLHFAPLADLFARIWNSLFGANNAAATPQPRNDAESRPTQRNQPPNRTSGANIRQLNDVNNDPDEKKDKDNQYYNGNSLSFDG